MKTFLLIALLSAPAMAGHVQGTSGQITFDDTWSHKDFSHRNLNSHSELKGQTIYQTNFYQERLASDSGCDWIQVFPTGNPGMTFINCNLDNVQLPPNATVIDSTHRRIKVFPDGCDWEVDSSCNQIQKVDSSCGQ